MEFWREIFTALFCVIKDSTKRPFFALFPETSRKRLATLHPSLYILENSWFFVQNSGPSSLDLQSFSVNESPRPKICTFSKMVELFSTLQCFGKMRIFVEGDSFTDSKRWSHFSVNESPPPKICTFSQKVCEMENSTKDR